MGWFWWALLGWAVIVAAILAVFHEIGRFNREADRARAVEGATMRESNDPITGNVTPLRVGRSLKERAPEIWREKALERLADEMYRDEDDDL